MELSEIATIAALGPEWDGVFAAGPGVQSRRPWFAATEGAALPRGARAVYLALARNGAPAGLLPLQRQQGGGVLSLTSPYSVLFQPLLAAGTDPFVAGHAFARRLRRAPLTRLEALDPAWPGLAPFLLGARRAGLVPLRFDHFGNWHEDVRGGWDGYLESRPSQLRATVRRRLRAAAKAADLRHEILAEPAAVAAALPAYEAVYARSWKEPEPFSAFNPALLPALAGAGVLRLALLWRGRTPIAAQYWTLDDGCATVLKLAHDEAEKSVSPGTVLTALSIQALLLEGARSLDFGRGDDPYKRGWAGNRRQRIGVVLANPLHPRGLLAIGRHALGALRRRRGTVRDNRPPRPT